jgi:plasmid stability protein
MQADAQQNRDKLMVRVPDGMRTAIKVAAARNRRSVNSEVVFHLDRIFGEAAKAEAAAQNE